MKHLIKTMAFTLLGLVLSMNLWGAKTVTYTVKSATEVTTTGSAPQNSSATLTGTGTLNSGTIQMTSGKNCVLTLSGFTNMKITGITLSVKSNSSKGTGSFTAVAGTTTIASISDKAFNTADWHGSWSTTLVDKVLTMTDATHKIGAKENVVLTMAASANSLYIGSWTITYEEDVDPTKPALSVDPEEIDFGTVAVGGSVDAQDVTATLTNTDYAIATLSGTNADAFEITAGEELTETGTITVQPKATTLATKGTYSATLEVEAEGVDDAKTVTISLNVAAPTGTFNKFTGDNLKEGDYVICDGTTAMNNTTTTSPRIGYQTITVSNNKIENPDEAVIWHISADPNNAGYWLMYNEAAEKYAAFNSTDGRGTLLDAVTDYARWQYTTVGSNKEFSNKGKTGKYLRYNNGVGFASYATSTGTTLTLYKKQLAPTNEAVTFAAPEGGSLVIKNDATPIATGATIQDGTVLDVEFGMTPAEAYKNVAIKVTNTSTSEDVTTAVYDAGTKKITMPRYAITVEVTSTKLYKIEAATVTGGSLSWEDANKAKPTYVEAGTYIQALQEEATHYEFKSFDIYKTDDATTKVEDAEGMFEMPAYDVTISGTFEEMQCTALPSAPVLGTPSISYAEGVTLNWTKLDAASGYIVNVWKGTDKIVVDEMITDVNTLSYKITAELGINTEYSYSIAGIGDDETYCMIGNPANESTFKTADYPEVVLTLSENGNTTPVNGKLNTPIELPTTSTQACDGKVFMGWSENAIDGEVGKDQVSLLDATYTFTDPNTLSATIYAVYAKENQGTTTNWEITSLDKPGSGTGYTPYNGSHTTDNISYTTSQIMMNSDKIQFQKNAGYMYNTTPFSGDILSITIADITSNISVYEGSAEITTTPTSGAITLDNGKYTFSKGKKYFHIKMGNATGTSSKITVAFAGESTYSNYSTTCEAAIVPPTFSLTEESYTEAKTLELTAPEGDIYFKFSTDAEYSLYNSEEKIKLDKRGTFEISAYAKVDDRTSETVTKTYTLDWAYTLAELVDEGAPTTTGRTVTVILTNEVIESIVTSGSYTNGFYTMVGDKKIEVYCKNSPSEWEVGGKVSGTVTCPWKLYSSTWELCPTNWDWASYTAPAKIESLKITGDVDNKNYTAGQKLDFTGLTVTGVYSDKTEEDVTEEVSWTEVTLTQGQESATATATLNSVKTGNQDVKATKSITGLTVGAAKTLESIYVADDSEHKTAFFVGRPFSAEGLKVMAKYNIGDDQQIALANLTIDNPTFSAAEAEHTINISYTENEVEKNTSYKVAVSYMNLSDLVAATDINDHDHVYVKFENVMITDFYSTKGIYLNVQKGDKDIEIYNQSANYPNTWAQYGTVSATLDNVEWTTYQGTWEFKISDWSAIEYTAPNIPVTSMEISPAEVSVGETKTTTLSIVYTPEHATNTGVTWAVTEGSDFASVDAETGVVTGIKAGTATITATLTADPTITATRTVTVTETPKCTISYYVKGEVASTQEIAREEEGTLTYKPTLVVAGYTFAGWAEAAIAEETSTATLITKYTPGAEETAKSVYAVFKRVDDSSPTYQQYAKVTSALTDWAGNYLLVYEDEGTAYVWTGVDAASCNVTATIDGNVISSKPDGAVSLTIAAMTDGYSIQVKGGTNDGKYIGKNASGNGMDIGASAYKNTISISENNAVITSAGGSKMRYNTANDQKRFRYYGSGQQAVQLYKYDEGSVLYTSNPVAKVKVTFNLDGGVGGCGTITVNEGEDVTLCGDAPTKDLYKFDAWSDGANKYAQGATITHVTEDIELTALWIAKKQYTITFSKGGAAGTTPASIKDYEYNEVTLPAQGDLSNPGYIFGGWNDGETTYAGGASFTMPEKNVSMTAVWVAKTNDKWYLVTSADQLAAGKQYAIVSNEKGTAMGAKPSDEDYMANVTASFNADKSMMIAIDPSAVILTLGGNATDGWTLSNNGQYLGSSTVKKMAWSTEVGDANKWEITIADGEGDYEAKIKNTVGYLCYNASSPRFTTYSSVQSKVQLYVLVPAQAINEETNASDLQDHADVTVNEGGNLLVTEGEIELGDIYVMAGGKVTISGTATLTVTNFVIKSTMGAGQSGQVLGVTSTNFEIKGEAYYDVVLGDNGNPDKWHAFAVPFNVDAINGVYDLDDNKLTNEVNYAIMDYHGDVRAQGQYGWKKFRGIMQPGVFYLMTVDGLRTTYRMKMNGGFHASGNSITVNEYASGTDTDTDAGWNGIANNQLGYSSVGVNVQVLNPTSYTYKVMTASEYNFTVGTPFFYQAEEDGSVVLAAANSENPAYAPRMMAEAKNIAVTLGNDNYTDRLYISATDEATNEYQIGRDLVKMTMTNAPAVPQIFAEAYGTKLCMVDAPMMYDEAVYALNLYAPANGEYAIGAAQVEGYEVFLTQYGSVIWNLSMSEATVELTKGNNTEYGLILKATSGHAPTDINTLNGQEPVQKFLYNSNIYLRHNNKTFDVQGQLVK